MQRFGWSRMWTSLVVGVSILGLSVLWSSPAKAVGLSNSPISWSTFMAWVNDADNNGDPDFNSLYPPLTVPFDFFNPPPGTNNYPDGEVFTAAYPGAGAAAGKWIYVYQINLLSSSDVPVVNGLSLIFITNPDNDVVDDISSFYISSGTPSIGFGLGTQQTKEADWFPPPNPTLDIDFEVDRPIMGSKATHIFGVFSSLPPTLVDATVRDALKLVMRPLVYTPTPEPSAWMLLGLGLLGGLVTRLQRRKK